VTSKTTLAFPLILLVTACADDGAPPDLECTESGRYLPLAPGNSWTFRVDDGNSVFEKTQTVGDLEDVGGDKAGTMAYRLTTTKVGGTTVSWQEDTGDGILRHRELDQAGSTQTTEVYEPYKLRLDETAAHTTAGATWGEDYMEIITDAESVTTMVAKHEDWEVEAVDEPLAVPAGDFCTLRVKRTSLVEGNPGSIKTYWYVAGVGKIKEEGDGQTELLTDYSVE